jgi:hypothetical protein
MLGTNSSTYTPHWLPTAGTTQKLGKGGIKKHKRRAQLASEAYLKPEERRHEIGGYFLDNSLSDKRTAVYHNPKKNKTFMALRGTDFKDVGDLHMDKHILEGSQRNHAFFKKDEADYDKVAAKYKGSTMAATGHSAGGNRSAVLSKKKDIYSTGFNTGRGIDQESINDRNVCNGPNPPSHCGKHTGHHVVGDGLSMLDRAVNTGPQFNYSTKGLPLTVGKHSMDNFIPTSGVPLEVWQRMG